MLGVVREAEDHARGRAVSLFAKRYVARPLAFGRARGARARAGDGAADAIILGAGSGPARAADGAQGVRDVVLRARLDSDVAGGLGAGARRAQSKHHTALPANTARSSTTSMVVAASFEGGTRAEANERDASRSAEVDAASFAVSAR